MDKWNHLDINECYLGRKHGKAYLVRMPSRSEYDGFIFWHPATLVKQYMDGTTVLNFPNTWVFRLKANGGALSREITAAEFLEACDKRDWMRYEKPSRYYAPKKLEAIDNPTVIEELMDDDD